MSGDAAVSILVPKALASDSSVAWAAEALAEALARRDIAASVGPEASDGTVVEVAGASVAPSFGDGLPEVSEGMALLQDGDRILAWGHDPRGIVYALTELADRTTHATGDALFPGTFPLIERPTARIRSMARLFCSEEEDKGWFHDRQQWRDYLSMLAANRFNRFALTLGMGYNYPYHNPWITDVYFYFPYPFLVRPRRLRRPRQGAVARGARGEPRDAEVHRPRGGAARARLPARALDPALRLRRRAARQLHGRGRDRREPRALLPRRDHPAARGGAGDHRHDLPRPRRGRHRRGRLRLLGGGLRRGRRRRPPGRDRHARQGPRPQDDRHRPQVRHAGHRLAEVPRRAHGACPTTSRRSATRNTRPRCRAASASSSPKARASSCATRTATC